MLISRAPLPCCYGSREQEQAWLCRSWAVVRAGPGSVALATGGARCHGYGAVARGALGLPRGGMSRPQIIHSGHFMVSEPHADAEVESGPGPGPDGGGQLGPGGGPRGPGGGPRAAVLPGPGGPRGPAHAATYDFLTVTEGTCQTYRYGPRSTGALSIDASLTRLFECMTLAYSGKIVSPKWKTFKGLKLLQRDKIRLNNAIWRAWYLQYVEKRKNPVCNFVTPLEYSDGDDHRKPEVVIMEGKYWKRHIEAVVREYHKWRAYFRTQVQNKKDKPVSLPTQGTVDAFQKELGIEAEDDFPMELDPLHDLDIHISNLADTIFYTRNPYGGPNPRGLAHQGNADMIQPTLTQLHPNLGEDFMDTLDHIHDFLAACRPQAALQASTPLPDVSPLVSISSTCDTDVTPSTTSPKEMHLAEDSVTFPLELEPPLPINGQQIFLPLFPTSPVRVSPPPPAPPALHLQTHPTLVFSVITHATAEKAASNPGGEALGGTFAVPMSGPVPKEGRRRQLQRIAPAPTSRCPPAPSSSFLTQLLRKGPTSQPLVPARNSPQISGIPEGPAGILLTEKSSHPHSSTAPSGTDPKAEDGAERRRSCSPRQTCSLPGTKGGQRPTLTSSDHTRRMNISSSFDALASLVLQGSAQPSFKLSKAVLLQRSAAYVGRLQQERQQVQETAQRLRSEIEELSAAIGEYQRQLPPSGAPVVAPPSSDRAVELYNDYVRRRTLQDWRFWLFSVIIRPLFESYSKAVSTSSTEEFCQSVLGWLEQHCALPMLRPAISSSLLQLSKMTSILTQPSRLPEQALQAVSCPSHGKGHA
uniref:MLX-interacting protein-like n=1 Tax=Crocodylus porosus TaxID=8502 RepID=A0A7M4F1W7_CROPO